MKATCDACLAKRGLLTTAAATAIIEENTRLRAALAQIQRMQPTKPVPSGSLAPADAYLDGFKDGNNHGLFFAAEMARAALGGGT